MICIVLIFGAPVIDPHGKVARRMSVELHVRAEGSADSRDQMKQCRVLLDLA